MNKGICHYCHEEKPKHLFTKAILDEVNKYPMCLDCFETKYDK